MTDRSFEIVGACKNEEQMLCLKSLLSKKCLRENQFYL